MMVMTQPMGAAMAGFQSGEDEGVKIETLTQYLPDSARLAERETALRETFGANSVAGRVSGTFDDRALMVARSIATPDRYVEFGPYWWAVKSILNSKGDDLGDATDLTLAAAYRADTEIRTLIAATDFAAFCRSRFFAGTRVFDLGDESANAYTLLDEDMEDRRG